jgi:hypothetical protein
MRYVACKFGDRQIMDQTCSSVRCLFPARSGSCHVRYRSFAHQPTGGSPRLGSRRKTRTNHWQFDITLTQPRYHFIRLFRSTTRKSLIISICTSRPDRGGRRMRTRSPRAMRKASMHMVTAHPIQQKARLAEPDTFCLRVNAVTLAN